MNIKEEMNNIAQEAEESYGELMRLVASGEIEKAKDIIMDIYRKSFGEDFTSKMEPHELEDLNGFLVNNLNGMFAQYKKTVPPFDIWEALEKHETRADTAEAELTKIRNALHYPDCLDISAYPTLVDAIREIGGCCSQCDEDCQ